MTDTGIRKLVKDDLGELNDDKDALIDQMISEAKKKFNEIRITCPGAIFTQIGSKARIEDHILGSLENLTVHDLEYSLSQNGEFTTFTLLEG